MRKEVLHVFNHNLSKLEFMGQVYEILEIIKN